MSILISVRLINGLMSHIHFFNKRKRKMRLLFKWAEQSWIQREKQRFHTRVKTEDEQKVKVLTKTISLEQYQAHITLSAFTSHNYGIEWTMECKIRMYRLLKPSTYLYFKSILIRAGWCVRQKWKAFHKFHTLFPIAVCICMRLMFRK